MIVFVVVVVEGDHVEAWGGYLDEAEARKGAKEARKEHPNARVSIQPVGVM